MSRRRALRRLAVLTALAVMVGALPSVLRADTLLATLPVGRAPTAVAVDPVTHKVFVANYYGDSVSVIDGVSESVVATIPMPMTAFITVPNAVVVDYLSATPTAYVANFWSDDLVLIDEASLTVTATVDLAGVHASGPRALALNASVSPSKVYVANFGAATVGVHDGRTGELITDVPVGVKPRSLAVFSSITRQRVYSANRESNTVTIIDGATDQVVATVPTGVAPKSVVVHPSTGTAYVANETSGTVTVIGDSDTVIATIAVGSRPIAMTIDEAGGRLFVTNYGGSYVSVIDTGTNTLTAQVPVPANPWGIAFDNTRRRAVVACSGSGATAFIDDALNVTSVVTGLNPYGVAIDESLASPRAYVTDSDADTLSILGDPLLGFGASLLAPPPAFAAAAVPVALAADAPTTVDGVHYEVTGTATDLRTPYVSGVVAVLFRIDGETAWRRAEITSGAGAAAATWRATLGELSPGPHALTLAAIDQASATASSGEVGNATSSAVLVGTISTPVDVSLDIAGPAVTTPQLSTLRLKPNRALTIAATADDAATGGSRIASMSLRFDDGLLLPMLPEDGTFDEVSESASIALLPTLSAGTHTATVLATDAAGNTSASPSANFEVIGGRKH